MHLYQSVKFMTYWVRVLPLMRTRIPLKGDPLTVHTPIECNLFFFFFFAARARVFFFFFFFRMPPCPNEFAISNVQQIL